MSAIAECPRECGGQLAPTDRPDECECTMCGHRLRRSVVDRLEHFKRVADRGGPASKIAELALKGAGTNES